MFSRKEGYIPDNCRRSLVLLYYLSFLLLWIIWQIDFFFVFGLITIPKYKESNVKFDKNHQDRICLHYNFQCCALYPVVLLLFHLRCQFVSDLWACLSVWYLSSILFKAVETKTHNIKSINDSILCTAVTNHHAKQYQLTAIISEIARIFFNQFTLKD